MTFSIEAMAFKTILEDLHSISNEIKRFEEMDARQAGASSTNHAQPPLDLESHRYLRMNEDNAQHAAYRGKLMAQSHYEDTDDLLKSLSRISMTVKTQ